MLLFPLVASATDGFQTPSGNIHCELLNDGLRCGILPRGYTAPARPPSCGQDRGGSMRVTPKTAEVIRMRDTVFNPGHPVLAYGTVWQGGGITCISAATWLRLRHAAGQGLQISRARLSFY